MNNYNMSDSGINIELYAYYDTCISYDLFNENIVGLGSDKELYIYTADNQLSTSIDFSELTVDEKYHSVLRDYVSNYYSLDFENYSTRDLLFEALYTYNGETSESYKTLIELSEELGLETNINDIYKLVSVRGYSQGDYAEILINFKEYQELSGCFNWCDKVKNEFKEEFTHYFYDSPISARIEINDSAYYIEPFDGTYNSWDSEVAIKWILENVKNVDSEVLKNELENITPSELSYD